MHTTWRQLQRRGVRGGLSGVEAESALDLTPLGIKKTKLNKFTKYKLLIIAHVTDMCGRHIHQREDQR